MTVKEQRVYGSSYDLSYVRCILLGFERNRSVRILSNQITPRRHYTNSNYTNINTYSLTNLPLFITGFTDAEGSFMIMLRKSPRASTGWKIELNFTINLYKKDVKLLKYIQEYFGGVGRISKERNGCCDFTVNSLDQIVTVIIPHFDKHSLITQKLADYLLFRKAAMIMKKGEHLTLEGLKNIINFRASMNRGLTPALKESFTDHVPATRPLIDIHRLLPINPYWMAGFTSGDGSFSVRFRTNDNVAGGRVELVFVITQHFRDLSLINYLPDYFGCGQSYSYKEYAEFKCQNFKNIYEKILPFFIKYPILGVKSKDFEDWAKIADIIHSKAHLTKEGFEQIRVIKSGMNTGRENV